MSETSQRLKAKVCSFRLVSNIKKGFLVLAFFLVIAGIAGGIVCSEKAEPIARELTSKSVIRIDSLIEEMTEKETLSVIVLLEDEALEDNSQKTQYTQTQYNYSSLSSGSSEKQQKQEGLEGRERLEQSLGLKKLMIKRQQDKVLSGLKEDKENKEDKISLVFGKGIFGNKNTGSGEEGLEDFELHHRYLTVNGFSGKISRRGLEKLRNNPDVKRIELSTPVYAVLDGSVPFIQANGSWGISLGGANITGKGETICVIDTGVDYNHSALGGGWGNKVIGGYRSLNNGIDRAECSLDNNACFDDNHHGTHVAGIIASNDTIYRGVAPDAKLIAVKALNSSGGGDSSDMIAGIDWCVNNASKFNISVITMSLGDGKSYNTYCDDVDITTTMSINTAVAQGIVVTVASGNCNGVSCFTGPSSPACVENATAVGAVNGNDEIVYQRGPLFQLLAPGVGITSSYPTNLFQSLSGTSMSTPHAAGGVALLQQFSKLQNGTALSSEQIKRVFNATGKKINDSGGSNNIFSRIDILAAIQSLDNLPPGWSNNATNSTTPKKNDAVQFNTTWSDAVGLSFCFFSWNDTGVWLNSTNRTLGGKSESISLNQTITATRGKIVYWKFYCNDTNNNWNATDEYSFIVQNTIPVVLNLNLSSTDILNRTNGSLVTSFYFFDEDNDSNTLNETRNETRWYSNGNHTSLLDNLTSISPGNLSKGDVWLFSLRLYDGYNWSEWYNSSSITILNKAPEIPILNYPANNTIIRADYTLLNWTVLDNDSNAMKCYIYGGNQSNETLSNSTSYTTYTTSLINITENIANGSYSAFNWTGLNETTYYWKVQCDDGSENSSNSSIYQFTIAIPPSTYPTLLSAVDYDSDGNIELNWSDDGNETGENYRVYRHSAGITSINSSITNLTQALGHGIPEGVQFFEDNTTSNGSVYWYVLATVDSKGNYNSSVFSNSLNGTANDTIKPRTATNLNITASGSTASLSWHNVSKDVNGNPDFYSIRYVVYYGTEFNSSKALANESITGYAATTVSLNYTSISVTSSGTYHFIVTSLDDGGNSNLTLDYTNNYGNASLTYTPPQVSSSGGGSSGGGGGGGGGGSGGGRTTNLDNKPEFISGPGYSSKQTQGDESTFTLNGKEYIIKIAKLKADSVTINVAGASSLFKEGDKKEFDIDNDRSNDIFIALGKISGGRAEVIYRMLAKAKKGEEEPEKIMQIEEEPEYKEAEEETIEEEKPKTIDWHLFIAGIVTAFIIVAFVVLHRGKMKRSGRRNT